MLVSVLSLLAAASAVSAQSSTAPVVADNPIGAKYVATLPQKAGSSLAGSIEGVTAADGKGVKFTVHFSGLPATGGPFMYHIHAKPVPADGNCTGTGAHLDPYHYGEEKACDASKPEICQTGDLSGKHGKFDTNEFSAEYTDLYSATLPTDPAFFGNLSFVLHLANKTRIGCANFHMVSAGETTSEPCGFSTSASPTLALPSTMASSGYAVPTSGSTGYNSTVPMPTAGKPSSPSAPSASSTSPVEFPGAASKVAGGAGALFAAAAAAIFAL